MNPSPDRAKECLPPKKRESRQGSSEQRPLEDDFKPPAPLLGSRGMGVGRPSLEGGRDTDLNKELLPPPPPPPPLPHLPLALPWQVSSYPPAMPHLWAGPAMERHGSGSGSPSWREVSGTRGSEGPDHPVAHHSRWLRSDAPALGLPAPIAMPPYKAPPYSSDTRDMWSYFGRRDYSPSPFSPANLFAPPSLYQVDPLCESRLRYPGRRPNGLDSVDSRSSPGSRAPTPGDYGNDSRARLGGFHANGRKRPQDDPACRSLSRTTRESPHTHSSPQNRDRERDTRGPPKAPPPHHSYPTTDAQAVKASPDATSGSGAQIYYALGSLYSPSPPQVHPGPPQLSPSAPPAHPPRNSRRPSPLGQHNSHGVEPEPQVSPGSHPPSTPDPLPTVVLPHFAKGSLIELAGGRLKRVEELRMEDFLRCADTSPEFHLSTCTVLLISPGPAHGFNHLQVLLTDRNTQELLTVLAEYPFFVRDRGWSSCRPERSAQLYGLSCRQLARGDVCLALTPTPAPAPASAPSRTRVGPRAQRTYCRPGSETSTHQSERMPPPPAPPPVHVPHPPAPPPSAPQSDEINNKPRPRKRRWSAPEYLAEDRSRPDLPQGFKRERQQ